MSDYRVCYVAYRAIGTDGWGRYTVELIRGMRQLGIAPVLVTAFDEIEPDLADIEHHPILHPVMQGRLSTPRTLLAAPKLRHILKSCDLVQATVELYAPLVALSTPPNMPFLLNAHGTWAIRPLQNRAMRLFFAPAMRRADKIICLSRFTHDWMRDLINMPDHKMTVLTGGVTLSDYQRQVDFTLPDWAQNRQIAFSVGAFKPRKGQHITLEGIAQAREKLPNLHYVLAGKYSDDDPYVQGLKRRVTELGIQDAVHFLGLVSEDDLVGWYQNADVFILNPQNDDSSFEGLGLVYLEAGAAGTPSIGSLNCGAMDAIIEGETGLLVPQNNPAAIAEALLNIFSDDVLRHKMGVGAKALAERLSWENLARQTLGLYNQALSS